MATLMASMGISLRGKFCNSPHAWWHRIRERVGRGEIEEKEVGAALSALIAEARRIPKAPYIENESRSVRDLWSVVTEYLVGGWLTSYQVSSYLYHLDCLNRFLPFPERVRKSWPSSPAATTLKGERHGGRL